MQIEMQSIKKQRKIQYVNSRRKKKSIKSVDMKAYHLK